MGNQLRILLRSVSQGVLVDEYLGPGDDVTLSMQRHHHKMRAIEDAGGIWVLEIIDPDGDMETMRVSNDPGELVIPLELTEETIDAAIEKRRPGPEGLS